MFLIASFRDTYPTKDRAGLYTGECNSCFRIGYILYKMSGSKCQTVYRIVGTTTKTNDSERHTSCSDKGAVTPIKQMMKERKVKKRQNMKKINLH